MSLKKPYKPSVGSRSRASEMKYTVVSDERRALTVSSASDIFCLKLGGTADIFRPYIRAVFYIFAINWRKNICVQKN